MRQMTEADNYVLRVSNLHKRYGVVQALNGLSFDVPRGAFYGLFGRNGSGKTTTFDIISGLTGRDSGTVEMLGEQVGMEPSVEAKRRFAYVGGHINLYSWMTLQEHLDYVAGFYSTWEPNRCDELMKVFRLPMRQRVETLSPGQHVQFQLLMALPRHPELLIMDEPGNLDPVVRLRLMTTMTEIIRAEQATILMASHLLDELQGVCDHMCIIDRGVTLTAGPVDELMADVRQLHFHGVSGAEPPAMEGLWFEPIAEDELNAVIIGHTEDKAEALARELGARSYDTETVSLQDFFIALTSDKD